MIKTVFYIVSLFVMTCLITAVAAGCSKKSSTEPGETTLPEADYYAPKTATAMDIDGLADEPVWQEAGWGLMDQLWISFDGLPASASDFTGRYKIAWDENKLYLLFEITDDLYSDRRANPLTQYWEDDCVEFFIDEDASGGDHTYNFNAFAYHVALDYQAVDLGTDGSPHLYTDHMTVFRTNQGTKTTWEMALTVFTSAYTDVMGVNSPKAVLKHGKLMGYLCAYCDSDASGNREHFYGSNYIPGPVGEARNLGWQTASVFGRLVLTEE
ncbi:CBM9 family sugar-binding protein [bacterium]|nr:CBM9 family sugar-binding protein [bacterium]